MFQKIGTRYYWYQNDHLGTPQKITDTNGKVVWSATYDSFADALILMEEIVNNLRHPGQYFDSETGFHYNWYRYYDPATGRYLSKDPIGFLAGDMNLYRYVLNNPINRIDALGLHGENEVHLVVMYERALMAGIQPDIAWEIAWASRGVDTSIWTRPEGPISWLNGQLWKQHFHPRDERLERRLRKSCEKQDPEAFGKNLHPLVDSFPHLDVNSTSKFYSLLAPFFHLREMDVDLYFGNTDRDLRMLEAVDYWMEEFRKSYYGPPPHPNILKYLNRGGGFR
jgi:RHS repeat-associated protein